LQARAQFKRRSTANNVEILVPVPEDADSPRFRTNIGSVHYAPEKSAIIWKIKQFGGGKEFLMRAELGLPSVKGDDEHGGGMTGGFGGSMGGAGQGGKGKRPISVKFEIPYFTTSGIQVRYLKIIEPKVSPALVPSLRRSRGFPFHGLPRQSLGCFDGRYCIRTWGFVGVGQIIRSIDSLRDFHFCRLVPNSSQARNGAMGRRSFRGGFALSDRNSANVILVSVAIPFASLGPVHHPIWGYRCPIAGCAMTLGGVKRGVAHGRNNDCKA